MLLSKASRLLSAGTPNRPTKTSSLERCSEGIPNLMNRPHPTALADENEPEKRSTDAKARYTAVDMPDVQITSRGLGWLEAPRYRTSLSKVN